MACSAHPVLSSPRICGETLPGSFSNILAGLLTRVRKSLFAPRGSAFDREITHLINQSGGRITDDLERQIGRRSLLSGLGPHG